MTNYSNKNNGCVFYDQELFNSIKENFTQRYLDLIRPELDNNHDLSFAQIKSDIESSFWKFATSKPCDNLLKYYNIGLEQSFLDNFKKFSSSLIENEDRLKLILQMSMTNSILSNDPFISNNQKILNKIFIILYLVCIEYNIFLSFPNRISEGSKNKLLSTFNQVFEEILSEYKSDDRENYENDTEINSIPIIVQLEHYINYAYATFQLEFDKQLAKENVNTNFGEYIKNNHNKIALIISFNYDLILERILASHNIPFYRIGTSEKESGIAIWKPHGSIDFNTPQVGIRINQPVGYPLNTAIHRNVNDKPTEIIDKKSWLEARRQVDLVLPTQSTDLQESGFNRIAKESFRKIKGQISEAMVFGISYMNCDREEIDSILLGNNWKIEIINTEPPGAMTTKYALLNEHISCRENLSY